MYTQGQGQLEGEANLPSMWVSGIVRVRLITVRVLWAALWQMRWACPKVAGHHPSGWPLELNTRDYGARND